MYAVNLSTRGPENARDIVKYANHPGGSKLFLSSTRKFLSRPEIE